MLTWYITQNQTLLRPETFFSNILKELIFRETHTNNDAVRLGFDVV
jgi:hypothetical protein